MTSPSHAQAHAPDTAPYSPTLASLMQAELLRLRSRRFVRWSLIVALAVMLLATVLIAFNDQALPSESDVASNVAAIGVAVAVLGFVLGATAAGAEWSNKTMPALLFWEPRRVRVFLVKLAALFVLVLAALAAAELLWAVFFQIAIAVNPVSTPGSVDGGEVWANLLRSVVLVLTASATGFGIASLTRNTGAALGVAFVYFAVAELILHVLVSSSVPWLLTSNIGALLTPGGLDVGDGGSPHVIGNVHGAIVLIVYASVLCGAGLELFRRRDVT